VPDVAANGDPDSGYRVFVKGRWVVGAGTSASAPVWAALVARFNQLRGRPAGLITPFLYLNARTLVKTGALRRVLTSRSGPATSKTTWNHHTGLGVPHGGKLNAAMAREDGTGSCCSAVVMSPR
jgi:kumamolisin